MAWYNNLQFWKNPVEQKATHPDGGVAVSERNTDIFKAYIPDFLYKPPYGMPRKVNVQFLKQLAKNPYVFAVNKTLADEAVSVGWEIRVKEEFQEDGKDYSEMIRKVTRFFDNPNGNDESFEHLLRQIITGVTEIDAGIFVKVFNEQGEFQQLFARDGATFLKNPDIYGYMGDRASFVPPLPSSFWEVEINFSGTATPSQQKLINSYDMLFKEQAAYFQYGWTAGSMPIPFGKREIVYICQNPRPDSIYGRSPVEVLGDIIMTLVYGSQFNLDFYTNNNMPEGVIQVLGANVEQIQQFRENWENTFKFTDALGMKRKKFFKVPITNTETKFTPFQLTSKDLEVFEQQKWFTKVMWMCYGVTADEMGFTEDSNRAVATEQAKVAKRRALKPLLQTIQYSINQSVVPEFFSTGREMIDFGECPLEFTFVDYDPELEKKNQDLLEQQLRMGVKTWQMAAMELGINLDELTEFKEKNKEEFESGFENTDDESDDDFNFSNEEKSIFLKHKYIKRVGSPGNYKYIYRHSKTGKLFQGQAPKKELMGRKNRINEVIKTANDELSSSDKVKIRTVIDDFNSGKTSKAENTDKNGNYTAKREQLHTKIIDSKQFNNPNAKTGEKEVFIFAGSPASGKTSTLKKFVEGKEYVNINADDVKEHLSIGGKKYDGYNAALLHQESSDIAKKMLEKHISEGSNILLDQTMKDWVKSKDIIDNFKNAGYKVHLLSTFVEPDVAVKRAARRFKEEGRYVPYELVGSVGDKIKANSFKARDVVDSYIFVDNNGDVSKGGKPFRVGGV